MRIAVLGITLSLIASGVCVAQGPTGGPFGLATFDATPPHVGDMAPDFALQDEAGKPIKLSDFRGKSVVVLQFGAYT